MASAMMRAAHLYNSKFFISFIPSVWDEDEGWGLPEFWEWVGKGNNILNFSRFVRFLNFL